MLYLIKFIFIAVIILWVIRLLIRLIFPVMLKNVVGNMQEQAANASQQQRPSKPEGSISIDYMPKKEKKGNADKLGDFVDYEEIK
ncbi:MAG: DUF4834 family protein [Bacteroidota bacterium]